MIFALLSTCACSEEIVHHLSETEANKILTSLHSFSIEAEKVREPDGTWAISVSEDQSLSALRVLSEVRLLPETQPESIAGSSVLSSREDQKFKLERSISRELEATLRNIPEVLESRVHLNLPAMDPLFGRTKGEKGSASVLLVLQKQNITREEVVALVSGASGIDGNKISVVMNIEPTTRSRMANASTSANPLNAQLHTVKEWWGLSRSMVTQIAVSLIIVGCGLGWSMTRRARSVDSRFAGS